MSLCGKKKMKKFQEMKNVPLLEKNLSIVVVHYSNKAIKNKKNTNNNPNTIIFLFLIILFFILSKFEVFITKLSELLVLFIKPFDLPIDKNLCFLCIKISSWVILEK